MERAHALRAPHKRRSDDGLWLAGILTIAAGFGSTAVTGFLWPVTDLSNTDGRCRIGLRRRVTIPLLGFDVLINILLTLIFVYLLSLSVRNMTLSTASYPASRLASCIGTTCSRSEARSNVDLHRSNHFLLRQMERLLLKTLVGSILIMVPTVGNLVALCILGGRELGWVRTLIKEY